MNLDTELTGAQPSPYPEDTVVQPPLVDPSALGAAKSRDLDRASIFNRLKFARDRNEAIVGIGAVGTEASALETLTFIDALEYILGRDETSGLEYVK